MARLIDADRLHYHRVPISHGFDETKDAIVVFAKEIDKATIVDAVPVVHGEWIWDGKKRAKCSICGEGIACKSEMMFILAQEKEHFCYNCGAKMGKSENNHGN